YMQQALEGEKVEQFPARGELPDKPKPENTNEPAAPKPEPTAPSGSNDGSDGGSGSSDGSGGSDESSDADKNKDENSDSDSQDEGKDDEKDQDGREDNGSSNGEDDNGSGDDKDSGDGGDSDKDNGGDGDDGENEGGSKDDNEPPDEGPSGGLPIEPPESTGGNRHQLTDSIESCPRSPAPGSPSLCSAVRSAFTWRRPVHGSAMVRPMSSPPSSGSPLSSPWRCRHRA